MKVIIALACVLACSYAINMYGEDGLVKFDFEKDDSPIGFSMKGEIDPHNDQNNKIQTFLKLAGYYIPILESMNSETNSLGW